MDSMFHPMKEANLPGKDSGHHRSYTENNSKSYFPGLSYYSLLLDKFPPPGPIGRVIRKEYPAYRSALCKSNGAFGHLFRHISTKGISMTAPVISSLNPRNMQEEDMSFLYSSPSIGSPGMDGGTVIVQDLPPCTVLSICVRGENSGLLRSAASALLSRAVASLGVTVAGPFRSLGYCSPMVPMDYRYWELQVPIKG
jgi:hypothetical protein